MIASPLRYPGGKTKLFPFFSELIKENTLYGSLYCEPYAGSAGLALKLLSTGFVDNICINDIDISIYAFWHSLLNNNDAFCDILEMTPITIDEWYKQRDIWKACDKSNLLELGFSTYFLNRTNRSGIIEGAGPIGGYKQNSEWKIDVRLVKSKQMENIKKLSIYSNQIKIYNLDAIEFISMMFDRDDVLMYLDPPYYVKGRKLYKNFYLPDDHHKIADIMSMYRHQNWIISYDNVPEIRSIYNKFKPTIYNLNYSAGNKTVGTEVIFLSDRLKMPNMQGFV